MNQPDTAQTTGVPHPFRIKDCALAVLATGRKARLLQEFRTVLSEIEPSSLYHHFWGGLLQPRFDEREYNNDFAAWVHHGIHDAVLAERLAALDPTRFADLESLRRDILELIDNRLDESEQLFWIRATRQFEFMRSQIVVFDTTRRLQRPEQLASVVPLMSTSSIFYHFVDARRRTRDTHDDFSDWLAAWGSEYDGLREQLIAVDPYFGSLSELRSELAQLFAAYFTEPAL